MAKVIGDITNNAISIATYNEREKINKLSLEKFKAEEKYGKASKQAQEIGKQITAIQNDIDGTYGIGSKTGMAIRAVTAALQAAAQNDTAGSLVALASPYLNKTIHEMTAGDTAKDKAANLMAHALLSAVEFQVTGKDPLTGAVAGVTGEVTAQILTQAIYNKTPNQLTANEKENISTLSQLAGGLAAALTAKANGATTEQGGNFLAATSGAGTAKRAVENNALAQGDIYSAYQRLLNGEDIEVVLRDLEHSSQKKRAMLADCDAACRQVVSSLLMAANDFSEEQAIAIGSILSKIPPEQRSRVDMLVQSENSKTLEAIENSKSDVEKHIALAVKVMRFFQAENAVSGGKPSKPKIAMSSYGYKGNNLIGNSYGKLGTVIDKPDINIAGLRKHYVDRKIQREVKTDDVFSTLDNPSVVLRQSNGGYLFLSEKAAVVVNSKGELVTTYGQNYFDNNIQSILRETKNGNK